MDFVGEATNDFELPADFPVLERMTPKADKPGGLRLWRRADRTLHTLGRFAQVAIDAGRYKVVLAIAAAVPYRDGVVAMQNDFRRGLAAVTACKVVSPEHVEANGLRYLTPGF